MLEGRGGGKPILYCLRKVIESVLIDARWTVASAWCNNADSQEWTGYTHVNGCCPTYFFAIVSEKWLAKGVGVCHVSESSQSSKREGACNYQWPFD